MAFGDRTPTPLAVKLASIILWPIFKLAMLMRRTGRRESIHGPRSVPPAPSERKRRRE